LSVLYIVLLKNILPHRALSFLRNFGLKKRKLSFDLSFGWEECDAILN